MVIYTTIDIQHTRLYTHFVASLPAQFGKLVTLLYNGHFNIIESDISPPPSNEP
ncbi:hypothetical protein PMAG_b0969 [Pseudoalteromonas mariniglutinosa NCIMB 1770]|nr:hypothetical protein [Pseudoalteromonas mariniglutinosa NCIMB 1770]